MRRLLWHRPQVFELTAGSNSDPHKMAGALAARVRLAAADQRTAEPIYWISCAVGSSAVQSCSAAALVELLASAVLRDGKAATPMRATSLLRTLHR